jgi:transposase-like protein
MYPTLVVCPNCGPNAQGRIGIHSYPERRYKCHECGKTFAETVGTPLYGLKHPGWLVLIIVTLLAYGCPIQAIVKAFGIDERTVADWLEKVGQHGRQVQEQRVCQGQVEVGQVQGDELCIKTQYGKVWMATAMSVFSRLFIWGEVSVERGTPLVERVVRRVRQAAGSSQPILWVVDGFAAWTNAIERVFRDPDYTGRLGRPRLRLWLNLHLVQVVKRYAGPGIAGVAIERRLCQGSLPTAQALLQMTQAGLGSFNTAYIERLNATFRTWIPALTRRARTPSRCRRQLEAAMFWTGCTYNFCHLHTSLSGSPAMAASLTDHVWSVRQLLFCFRFQRDELHAIL